MKWVERMNRVARGPARVAEQQKNKSPAGRAPEHAQVELKHHPGGDRIAAGAAPIGWRLGTRFARAVKFFISTG